MVRKKFSKDPKVKLVSLEDFLEHSDYLSDAKKHLWKEGEKPDCGLYYKITPRLLILIDYTWTIINFGMDFSEKLDYIEVAFRDGKTEYELFDKRMDKLLEEKKKHKKSKRIDESIENLEAGIKLIKNVKYSEKTSPEEKQFEDYLIDVEYPYITVEYGTDDISDQAQFYFMTDASPTYSQDKLMTFHICRSRDRYAYKLDLSNLPAWNNIVTMLRLDPVHYPSQYEGEHIHSECSIYSISVSSAPLIYTNEADYTGCQGVNQWEYCSCKDGIVDHLVYNDRKEVWEHQDGTHIGLDFQTGTNGTFASRNWRCPAQGKYRIVFSAKCDTDTDVYVMLDNHITLYRNEKTNAVHYENIVQVEENTRIQFVSGGGYLKKISIEIQKTLDNR